MRISDWSSDVCSSDLPAARPDRPPVSADRSAAPGIVAMRLASVHIENVRAIAFLDLPLHPSLTVLHGNNASGKTSVLRAIAVALGRVSKAVSGKPAVEFDALDVRDGEFVAKRSEEHTSEVQAL